jgi:L-rhamnose-H+ transport protein
LDSISYSGFALVILAGALNGSFTVPMKWTHSWAWENTWLAWSFIALVLFPVVLTMATISEPGEIYAAGNMRVLALVLMSGAAWGVSQVLFGLGVSRTGVALGFAVIVGLAAATGSVVPLLFNTDSGVSGYALAASIGIVLAGVGLCSYAGSRKQPDEGSASSGFWTGMLFCAGAGIGGSMINIGMVFGAPLAETAAVRGAPSPHETNAIWLPLMVAGFGATSVYCVRLLNRNGTWSRFRRHGHWLLATAMAVCWFGSVELYGIAAASLGSYGPVLGWPMFLSSSIITANVWGLATGEWAQAAARARRLMFTGVGVLVAAIFVLGFSSRA